MICVSSSLLRLSKGSHLEVLRLWGQSLVHCGTGKHQLLLSHLLSCYGQEVFITWGNSPGWALTRGEQDTWGHVPHFIVLSSVSPALAKITARRPWEGHMTPRTLPWYPSTLGNPGPHSLYMGGARSWKWPSLPPSAAHWRLSLMSMVTSRHIGQVSGDLTIL